MLAYVEEDRRRVQAAAERVCVKSETRWDISTRKEDIMSNFKDDVKLLSDLQYLIEEAKKQLIRRSMPRMCLARSRRC